MASYAIGENVIQEVSHIKYLGVTIDSQLSWSKHIKAIAKKANAVKGFYIGTYPLVQLGSNLTVIKV